MKFLLLGLTYIVGLSAIFLAPAVPAYGADTISLYVGARPKLQSGIVDQTYRTGDLQLVPVSRVVLDTVEEFRTECDQAGDAWSKLKNGDSCIELVTNDGLRKYARRVDVNLQEDISGLMGMLIELADKVESIDRDLLKLKQENQRLRAELSKYSNSSK